MEVQKIKTELLHETLYEDTTKTIFNITEPYLKVDLKTNKSGIENETDLAKIECNVTEYLDYNPPMKDSIEFYEKEMVLTVMQNLECCCTDLGAMSYIGDIVAHTSKLCNVAVSEIAKVKREFETHGRLEEPIELEPVSRSTKRRWRIKMREQSKAVVHNLKGEPIQRASRPLTKGEKEIIIFVYKQVAERFLSYPIKKDIYGAASALTSVSTKTVANIMCELKEHGCIREPIYARDRKRRKNQEDRMTREQADHLKDVARQYCKEDKTMDDLLEYVNNSAFLPEFKKTTLYTLLRNNGITFPRKANFHRRFGNKRKKGKVSKAYSSDTTTDEDDISN